MLSSSPTFSINSSALLTTPTDEMSSMPVNITNEDENSTPIPSGHSGYGAQPQFGDSGNEFLHLPKPPFHSTQSAPAAIQTIKEEGGDSPSSIKAGFVFGTCPSTPLPESESQSSFVSTPVAEQGAFEYPVPVDLQRRRSSVSSASAWPPRSASRRSSIAALQYPGPSGSSFPGIRRGSSITSDSTITRDHPASRRESLLTLPSSSPSPGPSRPLYHSSVQSSGIPDVPPLTHGGVRRGSVFNFVTRPQVVPIPPSLLARRGSLPAPEALFGLPSTERKKAAAADTMSRRRSEMNGRGSFGSAAANDGFDQHMGFRIGITERAPLPPQLRLDRLASSSSTVSSSSFTSTSSSSSAPGDADESNSEGINTNARSLARRKASKSGHLSTSALEESDESESAEEESEAEGPGSNAGHEGLASSVQGLHLGVGFTDPWK